MFALNRWLQMSLSIKSPSPSRARRPCTSACPLRCSPFEARDKVSSARDGVAFSGPGDASVGGGFRIGKVPGAESELEEIECDDLDSSDGTASKGPGGSRIKEIVQNEAVKLLAARVFSSRALHKKLMNKKFPIKEVDSVIVDLQKRGLLNDELYAESFSRSRWLSLSWGPQRIKRELLNKGINEEDANRATCHVFQDKGLIEDGHEMHFGMSKLNFDRLFEQASKQWHRSCNKTLENRKSSMIRWLQYRGFSWEVTKFIVRKLETEQPS